MCISGVFQASGNTVTAMILTTSSLWLLQLPLAYVLSTYTPLGFRGIWYALPVSNVITVSVYLYLFFRGDWKKKQLIHEHDVVEEVIPA